MGSTGHYAGGRRKHSIVTEGKTGSQDPVEFFYETVTLTSAAAATAVNIVPDARVGTGRKAYPMGYVSRVDGATNWATTASIKIQDTSAVDFFTITVNAATTNGNIETVPGMSNIAMDDAFAEGAGGTSGKGIQVVGNANGTGSDMKVTVWGIIK